MDDAANGRSEEIRSVRTPPYVSFKSFLTLVEELKTNGVPPQIDRSVLRRFAGGLGSQLVMAMKSLGLVDDNNKPTNLGVRFVEIFGTDLFKQALQERLTYAYPFLSGLDLMTATPSMFADAFKATGAKEDVLRKCRTFYLHAAQFAGVPLGPRILNGSVPRASSNSTAKRKARATKPLAAGAPPAPPPPGDQPAASMAMKLLEKFPEFDPAWSAEIQTKWFEGYQKLLTMGSKDNGGQQ